MDWPQAYLGKSHDAWQSKLFCNRGYPALWLIGRDGTVLANDWQTDEVRRVLDAVLRPAATTRASDRPK